MVSQILGRVEPGHNCIYLSPRLRHIGRTDAQGNPKLHQTLTQGQFVESQQFRSFTKIDVTISISTDDHRPTEIIILFE